MNCQEARSQKFIPKGNDAVLLIGPEGDFSKEEILSAISAGYLSVHLGRAV